MEEQRYKKLKVRNSRLLRPLRLVSGYLEVIQWWAQGKPSPPPRLIKVGKITSVAEQFGVRCFVETGTYRGDTVEAVSDKFEEIHTIELDEDYFNLAKSRFASRSDVHVHHGDSSEILPEIILGLEGSCIFWLDAHYSGGDTGRGELDSPLRSEIEAILRYHTGEKIVLIDDVRHFGSDHYTGYPTFEEVRQMVMDDHAKATLEVEHDIMCIRACN